MTVKMLHPKFANFSVRKLLEMRICFIQKQLDAISGSVKNASEFRNGTLLVEALNEKQPDELLKSNLLR
jgi:hypothetical protein